MSFCKKINRSVFCIWLSILLVFVSLQSFSVSAAETIPSPIAWQQSEEAGAEIQRERYLPEEENWCDYPWNRGTETGNTVGLAGCSLLSVVNTIYYKTGQFINPGVLAQFALDNGYRVVGTDGVTTGFFSAVAKTYGASYGNMTFSQLTSSATTALAFVRNGGTVCSNIVGHWIAIVDYNADTDQYLVLDSSQTSARASNIVWTDRENGVAWLSSAELSATGKSGYYGINGRCSALYTFEVAETAETCLRGDANGDNQISVEDACTVLEYYANESAGLDMVLNEDPTQHAARFTAADVDQNGTLTIEDAVAILTYYAMQCAGLKPEWEQIIA